MSLRDINKRYVDEVINYFIREAYQFFDVSGVDEALKRKYFESTTGRDKSVGVLNIESVLDKQMKNLHEKEFIMNWKVNVNLKSKEEKRDSRLEALLNDGEDQGNFIEVVYRMTDRTFCSVRIPESELITHKKLRI